MHRSGFAVIFAAVVALAGSVAARPLAAAPAPVPVKVAIVTTLGTIDVVLDPVHAPITVKNFLRHVDAKFYDGGTFFRAVPTFMIQGGNKVREAADDPKIPLESPLKTGLRNVDGAISMARTSDPDSASSEFFICDGDQAYLDGSMTQPGYAAFGHVTKNMDVVRRVARLPGQQQMLLEPVKIIRITRLP